jgi:ubiquinone/menaquinone biosynthesis C-methylase UbiE
MAHPRVSREKKQGLSNTYIMQDHSNKSHKEELIRLDEQDQLMTTLVGGLLPEQEDPGSLQSVLDVGCGSGRWLTDLAMTYPGISTLVGVDINEHMIKYARGQAKTAQVSERITFQVGDALSQLTFPANSFDLVHHRLGISFVRTWEWPNLLSEYLRICKPGGMIHISETALLPETNSPALLRLAELLIEAMYRSGHFFTQESEGVTRHLGSLLSRYGITHVQTKKYMLVYQSSPETQQAYVENVQRIFQTTLPFLRQWIKLSPDYQELYRQMVNETQRPDFVATQMLTTAWGTKSS